MRCDTWYGWISVFGRMIRPAAIKTIRHDQGNTHCVNEAQPAVYKHGSSSWSQCKILCVSSGGGHWIQLMMMHPAWAHHLSVYVSERSAYAHDVPECRFYTIQKANRWNPWLGLILACQMLRIVLKERPDVVISTGAACGFFAIAFAKLLLRSRTIWIDSVANCQKLSLSGRLVRPFADAWLTQWSHLASIRKLQYWGRVF